eukprot:m.82809 g.82809  ORF g.82809 m.82809 type:complete len:232 (+) comp13419_c1_seq1:693-1388(+)
MRSSSCAKGITSNLKLRVTKSMLSLSHTWVDTCRSPLLCARYSGVHDATDWPNTQPVKMTGSRAGTISSRNILVVTAAAATLRIPCAIHAGSRCSLAAARAGVGRGCWEGARSVGPTAAAAAAHCACISAREFAADGPGLLLAAHAGRACPRGLARADASALLCTLDAGLPHHCPGACTIAHARSESLSTRQRHPDDGLDTHSCVIERAPARFHPVRPAAAAAAEGGEMPM